MGYDIKRFVHQIDQELICTICSMVMENPLQSPCEHVFCSKCIQIWLKWNDKCPIDRVSLNCDDMKPTPKYFRNMVDRMEIRCDYEPKGCKAIIRLRHLDDHVSSCEFNPITVKRREYGCNSWISRQQEEIAKLKQEICRQQEEKDNEVTKLKQEICRQKNEKHEEISRLHRDFSQQLSDKQAELCQIVLLEISEVKQRAFRQQEEKNDEIAKLRQQLLRQQNETDDDIAKLQEICEKDDEIVQLQQEIWQQQSEEQEEMIAKLKQEIRQQQDDIDDERAKLRETCEDYEIVKLQLEICRQQSEMREEMIEKLKQEICRQKYLITKPNRSFSPTNVENAMEFIGVNSSLLKLFRR